MTASPRTSSVVLTRYTTALLDLAEEKKVVDDILKDFSALESMLGESEDLVRLVQSPMIGKAQQLAVMDELAKKVKLNALTMNFIGVLVQNRRLSVLMEMISSFRKQVSVRRGEVSVQVQTATELSEKQKTEFSKKIAQALGKDVAVEAVVVPEILGGMVVTVGSYMIDDSVRRKLERLGSALVQGANQNNTNQNLKEVV